MSYVHAAIKMKFMNTQENIIFSWCKPWLTNRVFTVVITLTIFLAGFIGWQPQASAILAQGDAVTDPQAILRYSLPIDNDFVRKLQRNLEDVSNQLRGKRWKNIGRDLKKCQFCFVFSSTAAISNCP